MARNHDEETPLGFVPKQTYEASEVSQTPERFRVVPRPPFLPGPVRFFRISSKTEEYAHVLDNLCSLRERSKPFDFRGSQAGCLWALFLGFSTISDALPTERLIEHLSLAIPGFPMSASNSAIARSGHLKIFISHLPSKSLRGVSIYGIVHLEHFGHLMA